ncbi:MAG TPA: hypothetical protein V6D17_16495 [Candidatus Obscuribacterales bacterium]
MPLWRVGVHVRMLVSWSKAGVRVLVMPVIVSMGVSVLHCFMLVFMRVLVEHEDGERRNEQYQRDNLQSRYALAEENHG